METRLVVIGTGSPAVAFAPFYAATLRTLDGVSVRFVLTSTATNWVSADALTLLSGTSTVTAWDRVSASHIELAEWATNIVVVPATLSFCSKLAAGNSSSFALMTALVSPASVTIFPSLPGTVHERRVWKRIECQLDEDGYEVCPTEIGISISKGHEQGGSSPAPVRVLKKMKRIISCNAENAENLESERDE